MLNSSIYQRLLCLSVLLALAASPLNVFPSTISTIHSPTTTTQLISVSYNGGLADSHSSGPTISPDGRFVAFESYATNLVQGGANLKSIYFRNLQTGKTELVSVSTSGGQTGGNHPALSANGRFVAFDSSANNLVPNDTNNCSDVFLRDRQSGQTERISVTSSNNQANASSELPVISADGRFVAFHSIASNLVTSDTNYNYDIFVRDRQAGTTELVSMASNGTQSNSSAMNPSISADGRFVVFQSQASNLVPGDTNGVEDIFLHDRQTHATERLSLSTQGVQGNHHSQFPSISADGRYIVFQSFANNLAPNDTNIYRSDIFLHDRQTGKTELISRSLSGTSGNDGSHSASISKNGHWVVFASYASNLVSGDTNGRVDIFLLDRHSGIIKRVSVSSNGDQANNGSDDPQIEQEGNAVVFYSAASNLVDGDTNGVQDIFLHEPDTINNKLTITHIEVTQVTQDEGNQIPLITGKPSLVRVYVDCGIGCNTQQLVTGSLLVSGPSGYSLSLTQNNPIAAVHPLHWSDQRGDINSTLNFLLPVNMPAGIFNLTAYVKDAQLSEPVNFQQINQLTVGYFPVRYRGGLPDLNRISNTGGISRWASKVYPTRRLFYYQAGPTFDWNYCLENRSSLCRSLSQDTVDAQRIDFLIALTNHYRFIDKSIYLFGWLPDGTLTGGYSRSPTVNGVSWRVAVGDDNPDLGRLIFAHEIAHLLGENTNRTLAKGI